MAEKLVYIAALDNDHATLPAIERIPLEGALVPSGMYIPTISGGYRCEAYVMPVFAEAGTPQTGIIVGHEFDRDLHPKSVEVLEALPLQEARLAQIAQEAPVGGRYKSLVVQKLVEGG